MKKALNILFVLACAVVMLTGVQAQAETKPEQKAIEIYPAHSAPADMSMMEKALHRRATEVAIWSMPLMNYKAMYDALHDVVGMNTMEMLFTIRRFRTGNAPLRRPTTPHPT